MSRIQNAALLMAIAIAPVAHSKEPESAPLKVMSFNIRYDNPGDGPNAWSHRKEMVAEAIESNGVDIVGMQEVLQSQQTWLSENLEGYATYGVGRGDGAAQGEFNPIFFRKDRFDLLDRSTFWLSETPEIAGSIGWDAAMSRICTWVRLRDRSANRDLFSFNTHLSHVGSEARRLSAWLLVRRIAEIAGSNPAILSGDFNCAEGTEPYRMLTENWQEMPRLFDTQYISETPHYGGLQSFNGFEDVQRQEVIDFLFCNERLRVLNHGILTIRKGDIFVSDHYPVTATVAMSDSRAVDDGKPAKPFPQIVFRPYVVGPERSFADWIAVELKCSTPDTEIRYTTDGSEPGVASPLYSEPIRLDASTELKARAERAGAPPSETLSASFYKAVFRSDKGAFPVVTSISPERSDRHKSETDVNVLLDGRAASQDFNNGQWVGVEGQDLDVTIDLGQTRPLSRVSARFLQDSNSRILLPKSVAFSFSIDGKQFDRSQRQDAPDLKQVRDRNTHLYQATLNQTETRFIRVQATNPGTLPEWHSEAGSAAWIFTDEIILE